ncbi:MAG: lipopolysaccharide core heptose(I) kinase RfaP [Planctomycetaceae bacterium]
MKSFEFEQWDRGRFTVNAEFADLFRAHQLDTFNALMNYSDGEVAKALLRERVTTRFSLQNHEGVETMFYIKRHRRPPWKEYLKPLLRFTWPILGAENEWNAILGFHQAGINTMIPVALGKQAGESFLVTQAIENCEKLSDWMESRLKPDRRDDTETARIVEELADITRRMHSAGLHHQDYYLTHFLLPHDSHQRGIHVIDLGRARRLAGLSRRWIVKDLAQLNYSAHLFNDDDRERFLKTYFGRPLTRSDQRLLKTVLRKTERIARHSRKNRL